MKTKKFLALILCFVMVSTSLFSCNNDSDVKINEKGHGVQSEAKIEVQTEDETKPIDEKDKIDKNNDNEDKDGTDNKGNNNENNTVNENPLELDFYLQDDGTYVVSVGKARLLSKIDIPSSYKGKRVTSIASYGFNGCLNLTSITIGNNIESIGESAFLGCSNLKSITVEPGNTAYHSDGNCLIETRSKTLILGCQNSVIPSDGSVTIIVKNAFYGCAGLKNIIVPDSVTLIQFQAFYNCTGLENITLPFVGGGMDISKNSYFGFIFGADDDMYNCKYVPKSLRSVVITGGTSIPFGAFFGCSNLTSITIPDSITSIGEQAFACCTDLKSITIPNSVTLIHPKAFQECTGLTSVTFKNPNGWGYSYSLITDFVTSIASSILANPTEAAKWLTTIKTNEYLRRS